jgi:hypothetical protein
MRKALTFFTLVTVAALMSGCIVSTSPKDNPVVLLPGQAKTFTINVLPQPTKYAWYVGGIVVPDATGNNFVYIINDVLLPSDFTIEVRATGLLGTDKYTWNVHYVGTIYGILNKTFGGEGGDWARSVQQTSDGGYILAGQTGSFGAGSYDAWLIKTDANGNKVWDKTFGGSSYDEANAVQQTSDGGYILAGETYSFGTGSYDAWLIKTDANGNKAWDKTFGGSSSDGASSVQQTSDGGYILAGSTNSYGAGYDDAWLIKTDANGNKVWDKTFGGSSGDYAYAVQQTSDGGYILAGYTNSYGAGYIDAWLIKTDANGNKVWDKTFGGSLEDGAYAVQQTSDGGYILAGYTRSFGVGVWDAWLIKTDANGNKVWDKPFGGRDIDCAYAVQQTSDGGHILAGYTLSFGAGHADAWLIKTDANGNKVWDKTFGGSSSDGAWSVQQTSDDGYILAGETSSFGDVNGDAWLIKTDAFGNAPATPTP